MKYTLVLMFLLPVFVYAAEQEEVAHATHTSIATPEIRWRNTPQENTLLVRKRVTFGIGLLEEQRPIWSDLKKDYAPRPMFPIERASSRSVPFALKLQQDNTTLLLRPNRFRLSIAF